MQRLLAIIFGAALAALTLGVAIAGETVELVSVWNPTGALPDGCTPGPDRGRRPGEMGHHRQRAGRCARCRRDERRSDRLSLPALHRRRASLRFARQCRCERPLPPGRRQGRPGRRHRCPGQGRAQLLCRAGERAGGQCPPVCRGRWRSPAVRRQGGQGCDQSVAYAAPARDRRSLRRVLRRRQLCSRRPTSVSPSPAALPCGPRPTA